MGFWSRLNGVIKSNLHAMVDQAEDPDKLIAQTLLDMKDEVKRARRELVEVLGTSKRLEKKKLELDEEATRWEEKAVLAVRAGDDALAREALKQKARATKEAETAARQSAEQAAAADRMQATLEKVEEKIKDLEARKASLAGQVRQAREVPGTPSAAAGGGAFAELERMVGRIDQLDAEVEAHSVLDDPKRAEVEAKFRALERTQGDVAVDDELAALKRKLSS